MHTVEGEAVYSEPSNSIQFYCYSAPTFEFVNLPEEIPSSEYIFNGTYVQDEGENLSIYQFNLYNANGVLVQTSGVLYASDVEPTLVGDVITYDLSYTIQGLENTFAYYIEMVGTTVENTKLTTGRVYFTVNYQGVIDNVYIQATNQCERGNILIESVLNVLNGATDSTPIYIENKELNLMKPSKSNANRVYWNDLPEQTDISIRMVFRAPSGQNIGLAKILVFEDNDGDGIMNYHYDKVTKTAYCDFTIGDDTVATSNLIGLPNNLMKYVVVLKRISNVWSIEWDILEQPSGTLYVESNIAKVDTLGTLTPDVTYSLDDDGNLVATYPDGYKFNYDRKTGILKLTI